jgi:hypothetical protein
MATNLTIATLDMDLKTLGDAWIEDNRSKFIFPRLPIARTLSRVDGFSGIATFEKPKLSTFRQKGLGYWQPGQTKRDSRNIEKDTFTLRTFGRDVQPVTMPIGMSAASRLRRLEAQVVPGLLGELYLNLDYDLAAFLSATANFGSAKSFTTSASCGLDKVSDHANQSPINDIEINLQSLRKYRAPSMGWRLVCIMDSLVEGVLRRHPDYTGQAYRAAAAVAGSGSQPILSSDGFAEVFKAVHNLDDVLVSSSALNTAAPGASATIIETSNGLLWFGVIDAGREFDLATPLSEDFPDGAFALTMAGQPEVRENRDERLKIIHFDAEADYGYSAIRGSSFGHFYTQSGTGGIFTTLPT